jgi:hypothetical protein
VDSRVELDTLDGALLFDLFPGDTVELALGVGATYLDVDLRFTQVGTTTTVATEEALPVPMVAGLASVWLGPVEVSAFAGGFSYALDGDEITFLDADLFARWALFGGQKRLRGSLVVGYRHTSLDLSYEDDDDEVDIDLTVDGPYVGLALSL